MKKWIAMLLLAAMMLSLAACGKVNDSPVAILWSGDGEVKVPNSLINSMERAMYIENIRYNFDPFNITCHAFPSLPVTSL